MSIKLKLKGTVDYLGWILIFSYPEFLTFENVWCVESTNTKPGFKTLRLRFGDKI